MVGDVKDEDSIEQFKQAGRESFAFSLNPAWILDHAEREVNPRLDSNGANLIGWLQTQKEASRDRFETFTNELAISCQALKHWTLRMLVSTLRCSI
jgi:hypothetical protein